jgi:hypothetical protein
MIQYISLKHYFQTLAEQRMSLRHLEIATTLLSLLIHVVLVAAHFCWDHSVRMTLAINMYTCILYVGGGWGPILTKINSYVEITVLKMKHL